MYGESERARQLVYSTKAVVMLDGRSVMMVSWSIIEAKRYETKSDSEEDRGLKWSWR